jgi:hypothetical protein
VKVLIGRHRIRLSGRLRLQRGVLEGGVGMVCIIYAEVGGLRRSLWIKFGDDCMNG